jgi:hypothetical protein
VKYVYNVPSQEGPEGTNGVDLDGALKVYEKAYPKIEQSDGCWNWTGGTTEHGYPIFQTRGGRFYALHRVAVAVAAGKPLPRGWVVRHLCSNRVCLRFDHLRAGTSGDTQDDEVTYGRSPRLLSFEDIWEVFYMGHFMSNDDIAQIFGMKSDTIATITSAQRFRDIIGERPWLL